MRKNGQENKNVFIIIMFIFTFFNIKENAEVARGTAGFGGTQSVGQCVT